jgi:hypothetical protein
MLYYIVYLFIYFFFLLQCAAHPCPFNPPPNQEGYCDSPYCRYIVVYSYFVLNDFVCCCCRVSGNDSSKTCVIDECSHYYLDDCLQHDAEGFKKK